MTEFGTWDRVRHTYTNPFSRQVVREGNIVSFHDGMITYVTQLGNNFTARPENLTLISKRTRKRIKPTKREKELYKKLRALEAKLQYVKVSANDPYVDNEFERGYDFGQRQLARELLLIITEGKR